MSLDSGHFTVFSSKGSITSRNRNEDKSLNPKGIFSPAETDPGEWEFVKHEDGRFTLKSRGAPTGVEDDRVVAYVNEKDKDKAEKWIITRREPEGLYVISEATTRLVWWAPPKEDEDHQVTVRPLLPGPSAPPQALWKFVRA